MPPTKTKVTPPKPTEGSKKSHSVSSGTVPDPQDIERDIQLANTGLPSTLDEGTRKSKPLSKDEAQESEEDILGAGEEMNDNPQSDETQHQSSPPQEDKPTLSTTSQTEASDTDSLSDKILKNSTINGLYKGLELITQLLKDVTNFVKDEPATNKKIEESSETLAKISTQTTEILSSVTSFDFSTLQSTVKNVTPHQSGIAKHDQ
nr:hypothetical protein [Tanacetum cinerariifolium]